MSNLVDGIESCVFHLILHEVLQAAKYEGAHEDEGEEEAEVLVARLHGVGDGLKPHGPLGQLEDPHDPGDPEHLHYPAQIPEGVLLLLPCSVSLAVVRLWYLQVGRRHEEQVDVVGSDRQGVHDVHRSFHEGNFTGTGREGWQFQSIKNINFLKSI